MHSTDAGQTAAPGHRQVDGSVAQGNTGAGPLRASTQQRGRETPRHRRPRCDQRSQARTPGRTGRTVSKPGKPVVRRAPPAQHRCGAKRCPGQRKRPATAEVRNAACDKNVTGGDGGVRSGAVVVRAAKGAKRVSGPIGPRFRLAAGHESALKMRVSPVQVRVSPLKNAGFGPAFAIKEPQFHARRRERTPPPSQAAVAGRRSVCLARSRLQIHARPSRHP